MRTPCVAGGRLAVSLALLLSSLCLAGARMAASPPEPPPQAPAISLRTHTLPQGRCHVWRVAREGPLQVLPQVVPADRLQPLAAFVAQSRPTMAINGGYFDPANGLTTSFVSEDGQHWHDPRQNPRLTQNPALAPYLPAIFNRAEFRLYTCAEGRRYAIARHDDALPDGCTLRAALGAGPLMFPENMAEPEAFIAHNAQGRRTRDPLGMDRPNARSMLGIAANGDVLLGLFAQDPTRAAARGFTLPQAARLMVEMGAERVMALDGGSSSRAYAEGRYVPGKYDAKARPENRALKSVLVVQAADALN